MTVLTDINRQDGTPELRARARWLYYVLTIVFLSLIARLVFLQIIQGERYTFLSENNRIRIKRMPGTRGMVVDRQGQLMVDSRPSFDLLFVPEDFFFSSRRRHTRLQGDWSSDVCSSD